MLQASVRSCAVRSRRMSRGVIALLLLLLMCSEKNPIAEAIGGIADAAEERDGSAVMQHLSIRYTDASGGRPEVERRLRQYFAGYRAVNIAVSELETRRQGSSGLASFRVDFTGVPRQIGGLDQILPRAASYRFELALDEEKGTWRVTTARWTEEARPLL